MTHPANKVWRVLVVDDEPLVCDSVKRSLASAACHVEALTSAKQALETFRNSHFDLVLLDYEMPDMRGDELALAIKAVRPGTPVIMISAYPERLDPSKPSLMNVEMLIGKPFTLKDLRQAVATFLKEA